MLFFKSAGYVDAAPRHELTIQREDNSMRLVTISAVLIGLAALSVPPSPVSAQQPTIQRKVLLTQDLPIPGYQTVMAAVEIPAGGREGRHTHPGAVVVYIQEGVLTFDHEGKATMTYKAGDSFYIEANKIHEGINNGTSPVKAVATFVVEKGKPLTTQVP
jgi:quercetin dioxygenase-like cupin family protein